jgi:hypothetical protein
MEPRIYTYKVTFEEIPDWYWGVHKEKEYDDGYLGSPATHAWKWEFYTPILEICELFSYTDEGWTQARKVEDRCIKPYLNNPLCLNEHYGGLMSLEANRRGGEESIKQLNKEKDELGRSVRAMKLNEAIHKEKDDLGRSVHAMKWHEEKDDLGRSINAVKGAEKTNSQRWMNTDPCGPPFISNAPGLSKWQRSRGIDTKNRVRVYGTP